MDKRIKELEKEVERLKGIIAMKNIEIKWFHANYGNIWPVSQFFRGEAVKPITQHWKDRIIDTDLFYGVI